MADRGNAPALILTVLAFLVAIMIGGLVGVGSAWWLSNQEEPPMDPFRAPSSRDLGGDPSLDISSEGQETIQGPAVIVFQGPVQADDRVVLVHPDGEREELAQGQDETTWDPGEEEGIFRVQLERERQGSFEVIAERTFEVRQPGEPKDVAAAAAIGAAFSAVASVVGGVLAGQSAVVVQVAQESLIGLGESKMKDAEERRKAGRGKARKSRQQVRRVVLISIAFTVFLMAVFFTFEEMDATNLTEFLAKLPLVAPIAGGFALLAFGAEWLLALATGTVARFKLLVSGAITLVLSATIFRTAFGFPGYIDEDVAEDEELPAHVEGWRGIAAMCAFPAALLPFVVIGWWHYEVVGVAMNVGLAGLAAVAMPFRPMPGNDVWRWNKLASLGMWAGAFVLFFGFELGFMSLREFFITGLLGLAVLLATASWLFVRRQDPGWYQDLRAQWAAALRQEPQWSKATRGAVASAFGAIERGITAVARAMTLAARAVVERFVESKKAKAANEGIATAAAAFESVGPDVDTITITSDDDAFVVERKDVEEALLAQQVDALFTKLPKTTKQVTVIDPKTGEGRIYDRP